MSNKIKQFDPKRKRDTITVNDALELSGLHSQVATNTSEIRILKEQTSVLDGVRMEVTEIKAKQSSIDERLKKLDENDSNISKGIVNFRYWLAGAAVFIFTCIFGTLQFGLGESRSDQDGLKSYLEGRIDRSDERHSKSYDNLSQKMDKLTDIMIERSKK